MAKYITFNGETHHLRGWAKKLGITPSSITNRLKRGWPLERVLTTSGRPDYGDQRKCTRCGEIKPQSCFQRLRRRSENEFVPLCKECANLRCLKRRLERRMRVLRLYGGDQPCCSLCSERRTDVVDIDHIYGDGAEERRRPGNQDGFYTRLANRPKSDRYRILCRNCNWIEHLKFRQWSIYDPRL